jgi:uncharacterized protein
MSVVYAAVQEQKKMIVNLEAWIEKAVAYAKAKSFDPSVLLTARLAPDQYPFLRQVQSVCDSAKFTAARLAGKEPPKHPDTEQTLDEIRARIQSCKAYLDTFKPADFDGAEARVVPLSFMPSKALKGLDFLFELQLPNFFFHLTTAYAILRHNGVDVGKTDYIGSLNLRDA